MNCIKCGTTIPEGSLYCPKCGTPVQMVPDYLSLENVLSDEVNDLMDRKNERNSQAVRRPGRNDMSARYDTNSRYDTNARYDTNRRYDTSRSYYEDSKTDRDRRLNEREIAYYDRAEYERQKREREYREHKRKELEKRRRSKIIIICALVLIIIIAAVILITSLGKKSYNSQIRKGEKALQAEKYEDALNTFYNAAEINSEKAAPYLGMGDCYIGLEDISSAEAAFEKAVSVEPDYPEAYLKLAEFYFENDKKDSITLLFEEITDKKILDKCSDYIAKIPVISPESGSYTDTVNVNISASGGTIRYTMDGTLPNTDSPQYTEPIVLNESNNYTIIAVTINEKGIASSEARAEYKLDIPNPDGPTVNPSAGTYTEPTQIMVNVPEDSKVYYTLDGTTPDETSEIYYGPVDMPEGQSTFSCIAVNSKGKKSSVIKRQYNLLVLK